MNHSVKKSKSEAIAHVRALNHVFGTGEAHGENNHERTIKAMNQNKTVIPDLILQHKNQKPLDAQGQPKTRPVCLSRTTLNQRANYYLCQVIGATIKADPTDESISTEDNIAAINDLNKQILNGQVKPNNLMVGSLDVSALYTSITHKAAGIIAKETVMESNCKFKGIDYKWAGIYLAHTESSPENRCRSSRDSSKKN